jgi:hypothetical protein
VVGWLDAGVVEAEFPFDALGALGGAGAVPSPHFEDFGGIGWTARRQVQGPGGGGQLGKDRLPPGLVV